MKVKVSIFVQYNPLSASKAGGIGTLIRSYIAHAPEDFEFQIVGISDNQKMFPLLKWEHLDIDGKIVPFMPILLDDESINLIPLSARFTYALAQHCSKLDYTGRILHFHRPEPAIPFLNSAEKKFIFIHNAISAMSSTPLIRIKEKVLSSVNHLVENSVLPRVDRVWAVREQFVATYHQRYPSVADRISFMPTWVETNHFRPIERWQREEVREELAQRYGWPKTEPYLVFLGRLEEQKDPILLLKVIHALRDSGFLARLLVLGNGSMLGELKHTAAELLLNEHVTFFGDVARTDVLRLLGSADAMVLTSKYEGMPVAILEALACGVPVISTAVGDVHQALNRGGGRLVDSRSAVVLAQNIIELLKNPPTPRECLQAVQPFTPCGVLQDVYQSHYAVLTEASQKLTRTTQANY
jgi:glycosyltransferase involved in cell wall biosynthesis